MRTIAIVVSLIFFIGIFTTVAMMLHPFGDPPAVMDNYIIENAQEETGSNNTVTAVVFDYRGFDTLGEATILFTAVAGVAMLFRKIKQEEKP